MGISGQSPKNLDASLLLPKSKKKQLKYVIGKKADRSTYRAAGQDRFSQSRTGTFMLGCTDRTTA